MEEVGVLLVEGDESGAQGTEGFEACRSTKPAGDFLFDLAGMRTACSARLLENNPFGSVTKRQNSSA
ncbi:MAG: hypothetical protein ACRERU_17155 [Methylococcales bacterium]